MLLTCIPPHCLLKKLYNEHFCRSVLLFNIFQPPFFFFPYICQCSHKKIISLGLSQGFLFLPGCFSEFLSSLHAHQQYIGVPYLTVFLPNKSALLPFYFSFLKLGVLSLQNSDHQNFVSCAHVDLFSVNLYFAEFISCRH